MLQFSLMYFQIPKRAKCILVQHQSCNGDEPMPVKLMITFPLNYFSS